MLSLLDLWRDKAVRWLLIYSLIGATLLVAPYLYIYDGQTLKTFFTYLKEVGFAIFVSIPILITIELFNQKRHAAIADKNLREQAISLVKKGVPDEIWSVIDSSVIEASFYRTDFIVTYTLSLNQSDATNEYVDVHIFVKYKAKRMRSGNELLPISASLALTDDSLGKTKFCSFKVGSISYNQKELAEMAVTENGSLVVKGIPEQNIPIDESLSVIIEMETAFPLRNPFEAYVMTMPATGLTVKVNASKELKVVLDELHPNAMKSMPCDNPNEYEWLQQSGLIAGQGAIIRWEKASATAS